jgi:hypothetical protein
MYWNHNNLWQKTKVYADRAMRERREGSLFPFWASLTLEFLARAALARVHPVLLADPRGDESILYAFGYPAKAPVSVPMKTVVSRCKVTVKGFTDQESKVALSLSQRRNDELHTGHPAFEDFPTKLWLGDFFRTSKLLLIHQGKSLEDLFGLEEATAAETMISAVDKKIKAESIKIFKRAEKEFDKLPEGEKSRKRFLGSKEAQKRLSSSGGLAPCPACEARALITGQVVSKSEPRLEEDDIVIDTIILPTNLRCYSCDLELPTHGSLHALDLGGQFTHESRIRAVEYYEPEIDISDYDEPDYGND